MKAQGRAGCLTCLLAFAPLSFALFIFPTPLHGASALPPRTKCQIIGLFANHSIVPFDLPQDNYNSSMGTETHSTG